MQVKTQTFLGRVCVAAALAQVAIMKAQGISARNNAVSPLDLLADLQERAAQASNSLAAVMQNCAAARMISPEDVDLFRYADTPEEAWAHIVDFYRLHVG